MSRIVETVSGAEVIYFDCSEFDYEGIDWTDVIENMQSDLIAKYPSFNAVDEFLRYPYRETRIILQNDFLNITISEYCDCGAICIFNDERSDYPELAEHWLQQNYDNMAKIIKQYITPLRRIGTFSNGEAVFEKEIE